jgi:hypothetical protein
LATRIKGAARATGTARAQIDGRLRVARILLPGLVAPEAIGPRRLDWAQGIAVATRATARAGTNLANVGVNAVARARQIHAGEW